MKNNLYNHGRMSIANRQAVLSLLKDRDTISRIDLTHELKCNGTTITRIVRDLMDNGFVKSIGIADSTGGRPKELIKLDPDCRQTVAVSIEPSAIIGVVMNLRGEIKMRDQVMLRTDITREELIAALKATCNRLLKQSSRDRLLGMAVSTYGAASGGERNIIGKAAHFQALEGIDLAELFEREFSTRPELIDGTIAKALWEIWFGDRDTAGNFILLNLGTGIGFAVAEDGRISFTRNSHPGEFGHTVYDIHGEKCDCGRTGCLETVASIPAIEKAVKAKLKKTISFEEIAEMYRRGDPQITKVVDNAATALSASITDLVNLLIPNKIVLCGPILKLGEKFSNIIDHRVRKLAFPSFLEDLTIIESVQEEESAAMGAGSILLDKFFTHGFGENK